MTIEFESHGSRLLAVSVTYNVGEFIVSYAQSEPDLVNITDRKINWICTLPEYCCDRTKTEIINRVEVIGLSTDHPEHHEAMKEAGIYHGVPEKIDTESYKNHDVGLLYAEFRAERTSECWILLKINE